MSTEIIRSQGLLPVPPHSYLSYLQGFYAYFIYGENGELLYVGVTRHPRKRLQNHWHRARRQRLEVFYSYELFQLSSQQEAWDFESEKILELKPKFNKIAGNGRFA